MTTDTLHPLAAEYLKRLRGAGRNLPSGRLQELLVEIEGHLTEAIDPYATDADVLTVLDRLGQPEAIIAAEAPPPDELAPRRGLADGVTIILLLLGGFIVGVGWLTGLVLLWRSRAWSTRDKWIGTLVIPGGLATSAIIALVTLASPTKQYCYGIVGGFQRCINAGAASPGPSALGVIAVGLLVLAPIATSIYLTRRAV